MSLTSGLDPDAAPLTEAVPYALTLMANNNVANTIAGWDVDWGDGLLNEPDVEHYTAAEVVSLGGLVTHDYANDSDSHAITITMIDTDGNARCVTGGTARFFDSVSDLPDETAPIEPLEGYVVGNTVALQASGKMVVAQPDSAGNFVLSRYNADGSLDTSFGTNGTVTTDISCRGLAAAAVQPDDGIMLLGCKWSGGEDAAADNWEVVLEHYSADGRLDTSFGVGGTVSTDFFVANGKLEQTEPIDTAVSPVDQLDSESLLVQPAMESEWPLATEPFAEFGQTYQMLSLGESDTHYWTGGANDGGLWMTPDNWSDGAPEEGDILVFDDAGGDTENDFDPGTIFRSITFAGNGFTLDGNSIGLIDGITSESDVTVATIELAITLNEPLLIGVDGSLEISGILSGSGTLTKTGAGTLTLSGANTSYIGVITIENGTLELGGNDALGVSGNGVYVNGEDAVLDINGYHKTHDIGPGQAGQ